MSLGIGASGVNVGNSSAVKLASRARRVNIRREGRVQELVHKYDAQINDDLKFDLSHLIPSLQKEAQYIKDQWINYHEVIGHKRKLPDSSVTVIKAPTTPMSKQDEYQAFFFKPMIKGQYLPRVHFKTLTYKEPFNKDQDSTEILVESQDCFYQFTDSKKDSSASFYINSDWILHRFLNKFDGVIDYENDRQITAALSDVLTQTGLTPARLKPLLSHDINQVMFSLTPSIDFERNLDSKALNISLKRSTDDANTIDLSLILPDKQPLNFVFQENSV